MLRSSPFLLLSRGLLVVRSVLLLALFYLIGLRCFNRMIFKEIIGVGITSFRGPPVSISFVHLVHDVHYGIVGGRIWTSELKIVKGLLKLSVVR